MTQLIAIGNSQGVRIPKTLIEHAGLENTALTLQVVKNGLLISPAKKHRAGWAETIQALQKTKGKRKDSGLDQEWLDAELTQH